jgi:hypothetical protein
MADKYGTALPHQTSICIDKKPMEYQQFHVGVFQWAEDYEHGTDHVLLTY